MQKIPSSSLDDEVRHEISTGAGLRNLKIGQYAEVKVKAFKPVQQQLAEIAALAFAPSFIVQVFLLFTGNGRTYLINLDYFLVPAVVALAAHTGGWIARAVGAMFAALLMGIDGWTSVDQVFFADPLMIFDMVSFAQQWPWRLLLPLGLGLLALGLLLVWRAIGRLHSVGTVITLGCFTAMLLVADQLAGRLQAGNLVSSASATLVRPAINQWHNERRGVGRAPQLFPGRSMASSLSDARTWRPRILSVSIESWGVPTDSEDARLLMQALTQQLEGRYRVIEARWQPYRGSTLEGEVRELCSLQLDGIPRLQSELAWLHDCLPARLASAGWDTSGWHGNSGHFYRRSTVYPSLGFVETQFFDTMVPHTPRICRFLFVGICDADVLNMAVQWLAARPRGFAHVITLDTHLPLPPTKTPCQSDLQSYCEYMVQMQNSLQATAAALSSTPQSPDIVFVYGDHAPPFLDAKDRSLFRPGLVPFVWLERVGNE